MPQPLDEKRLKTQKLWFFVVLPILFFLVVIYKSILIVPQGSVGLLKGGSVFLNPGPHVIRPFQSFDLISMAERVSFIPSLGNASEEGSMFEVLWRVEDPKKFWVATQNQEVQIVTLFKTGLHASSTLSQGAELKAAGVNVQEVLIVGQNFSETHLKTIYERMQGLANTIAQGIVAQGVKDAAAIRAEGDQILIHIEGAAAAEAAQTVGEGQAEAIEINAPAYHQNPGLFKLLVDTKTKILQGQK